MYCVTCGQELVPGNPPVYSVETGEKLKTACPTGMYGHTNVNVSVVGVNMSQLYASSSSFFRHEYEFFKPSFFHREMMRCKHCGKVTEAIHLSIA